MMRYIQKPKHTRGGFTLIELLVVISIIGLLASVVLASLNSARAKARDAKRISEMKQMQTALLLYYDANSQYPSNLTPGSEVCSGSANWNTLMGQLVSGGFLGSVPISPPGATRAYCYYNYGGSTGGLLVVGLETIAPTMVAPYGSCRPFTNNWCSSTLASQDYCLCSPY